jgi:gamma-glutamylcyclotransferase (GGCT)/AIG2-like uncharacterized protein YtfP
MFLNGGGMRGGPLNHLLLGAPMVSENRTAPRYRFYAIGGHYPGLLEVAEGGGEIAGEVYDVPLEVLRDSLLPNEPHELELGIIELADQRPALAMVLRRDFAQQAELIDITALGGWRAYLANR